MERSPRTCPLPEPASDAGRRVARSVARRGWGVWLAVVFLSLMVPARAASLTATLDREVLGLGDSAMLKVVIEGGGGNESPRIPAVSGLRFTPSGRATRFEMVNRRQRVFVELSYLVTATRVGRYSIGPITASVGGQTLQADVLDLNVVAAGDPAANAGDGLDQAAFLELQVPERDVYVGEAWVAEVWLYALGGRLLQAPQLQADGFLLGKLQDGGQEPNIRTNNRLYMRARFLQPLTAARAGELPVQAANCILEIPVSRRTGLSDLFDDTFFGLRENRRFSLSSPARSVRVRPLPSEGVPEAFLGAVGDFEVTLTASPTNLAAGDPITVRVEVRGRGNFDAVHLPDQPGWRGFRVYPPTANFVPQDSLGLTGTKRFEQVISPEAAGLGEIPPLVFSYFSPAAGGYRTVRTPPIPIRVEPGAGTPALGAASTGVEATGSAVPELPPLRPHLGTWPVVTTAWAARPWFLGLAAVPWLVWLGAWVATRCRDRAGADVEGRRRRHLERRIETGLAILRRQVEETDTEAFFAGLFRLLQDMVGARVGLPAAAITEGDVEGLLAARGVDREVIEGLHRLFQACNQARYARTGGRVDLESLRAEAERLRALLREGPPGASPPG